MSKAKNLDLSVCSQNRGWKESADETRVVDDQTTRVAQRLWWEGGTLMACWWKAHEAFTATKSRHGVD